MDTTTSSSTSSFLFNNKPTSSVVSLNSNELHSIDFLLRLKKSQFKIPIELIKKNFKNLNKLIEKHNHTVLKYVSSIEKLNNLNENLDKKLLLLNKLISIQESYNKKLSFRVKQHNDFVDRLIIRINYLKTLNQTRNSLIKSHTKLQDDNNNNINDDDISNNSGNHNDSKKSDNDNKNNNGMSFNEMASYYDNEVNLLLVDYLIKMSNNNYTPATMDSNTGVKLAKFLKLDKLIDYDIILQGLNIYHEIKDKKNLKILIDWCNENKDALKLIRDSNLSSSGIRKQSSSLPSSSDNRSKLRRKSSSVSTTATDRPIEDPQNPLFTKSSSKSRRNTISGNTKINNSPPVIGYNSLEFEAHFQNFIEYIKDDNLFEALDILNNHLIDYIDTSSSSNLNSTVNDSFTFSDIKSRSNSSKRRKSSVISASDFLEFSNERTLDSLNEAAIEDDEDDKDSKSRRASHSKSSSSAPRMIIESKYEEDDEEEDDNDDDDDDENSENDPLNKNPEAFANFSKIQSGAALLFWNSLSSVVSDAKNNIDDGIAIENSPDSHDKGPTMESDIRSARRTSATLSYYDPEVETSFRINNNLKPYKILLDDERWKQLADFFLFNFNELYGIDQKLSLLTILSCGISALKTKSCENHDFNKNLNLQKDDPNKQNGNHHHHIHHHHSHKKLNGTATLNFDNIINDISKLNDKETMIATFSLNSCPICSTELFELTKELPFSHQIKSNIYENPVMLPNGNIYQRDKLIKLNQNFEMAESNSDNIININNTTNNSTIGSSDGKSNSIISADSMSNKSSLPSSVSTSTAVTSIEAGEDDSNDSNGLRNVSVNGLGVFYYDDDETDEEDEEDECGAFDNSTLDKFIDECNLRGSGNGKDSYGNNKKRLNNLNDFKIKDPITGDIFNKSQFIKVFPT
ncbi:hypothetical protein B5S32_g248 [[Candida] boidinii]|nr:hypothetical protein B5S32_g248 [[Candida] boidinii]